MIVKRDLSYVHVRGQSSEVSVSDWLDRIECGELTANGSTKTKDTAGNI